MKPKYILMDSYRMHRTLRRMALEVLEIFPKLDDLIVAGIRTRGVHLANYMVRYIEEESGRSVEKGEIDISFYRDDLTMIDKAPVVKQTKLPKDVSEKHVLIVDDVLFTGRTVRAAMESIFDYGRPKSIKLAILVDRGWRELPICADIVGIRITTTLDEVVKVKVKEVDGKDEVWIYER